MGGDREGERNGLTVSWESEAVAVENAPLVEETSQFERGGCNLEALLQRHEDTLVNRLDVLLREQVQSLRQEFGSGLTGNHVVDDIWGCSEGRQSHKRRSSRSSLLSRPSAEEEEAPVQVNEAPEVAGVSPVRRRMSVREAAATVGMRAPDMMNGALELRKKFKSKMILSRSATQTSLALSKFKAKHPIRGFMRQATLHPLFDTFFAAVVVYSVVLIGWEIEMKSVDPRMQSNFFFAGQLVCCILFFIEIIFRMGAQGVHFFFSRDYKWNYFDLVCLTAMVLDLSTEAWVEAGGSETSISKSTTSGRLVRVLRLLRIIRALRIMRATRTSREFRKMSYALQYSAQTLFWALLLLGFVMYFFATTFTQAASEALVLNGVLPEEVPSEGSLADLVHMYGSIPKSFRSLFMGISSGRDWYELIHPLSEHCHWVFPGLFIMFISVTVFGIMNVLTSVFVESALQSVQHYKDLLIQESMKSKKMYVDHLREVFHEIDTDDSGSITLAEMEQFLCDPSLMLYLESMDIQPDDARTLFRLLDKDDSGCVSIEEFCQGCLRLKGDAKSFDIHCIIFENHRLLFKWKEYMAYMDTGLMPAVQKVVEDALDKRFGSSARSPRRPSTPTRVSSARTRGLDAEPPAPPPLPSGEPKAPPAAVKVQMMAPESPLPSPWAQMMEAPTSQCAN